ncbi:hypothetical protein [Endozoicomonas sp.]|uniref:hypothetical protein n=1 Tax=Endozoicomonas sp. TaxID=1892382 RepID=UPI002886217B|nr:hypothetical protein [Endozoicomonas sp.]
MSLNAMKIDRDFNLITRQCNNGQTVIVRIQNVIQTKSDHFNSTDPYRLYNIGNNQPVELMTFIQALENAIGKQAEKQYLPMQSGDVYATYADVSDLMDTVGFKPSTTIEEGLHKFAQWYKI